MRFADAFALALALGCASDFHDRYLAEHPGWVPVLPSPGIDVAELVASLQAPPVEDVRLLTLKFVVLRTDVEPWEEHSLDEFTSGAFAPTSDADYAVVQSTSCQSTAQLQSYRDVRTSWYMLPKNKLVFWDHIEFNRLCVKSSDYFPARASFVATERRVAAFAAKYPNSSTSANTTYRKGLLLAEVGRTEDAEAMLAQGDAEPESGGEHGTQVRFDGANPIPLEQLESRKGLRAALVEAIAKAKTRASR
jgi:hypothetical protein